MIQPKVVTELFTLDGDFYASGDFDDGRRIGSGMGKFNVETGAWEPITVRAFVIKQAWLKFKSGDWFYAFWIGYLTCLIVNALCQVFGLPR